MQMVAGTSCCMACGNVVLLRKGACAALLKHALSLSKRPISQVMRCEI